VIGAFSELDVDCKNALPAFKLVALDIPPDADLAAITRLLREGEVDGRWGYDEGLYRRPLECGLIGAHFGQARTQP
jgi:hypothetical protein